MEEPIIRDGFWATVRARSRMVARSLAGAHRSTVQAVPALAVAGAVAVAGAAGYGVVRARASSGLAEQISEGVMVSQRNPAATRTSPPSLAASPPPPPSAVTAAAVPARVKGSSVFAVGDSVMLASAVPLAAALPGISIDAQVSRQVGAGLSIVQRLAADGRLRRVVVFALGTNGPFTRQQMRQLVRAVGPHRDLVLVSTYEARPWEAGVNRIIAAAARRYATVVMANWFAAIERRTGLLWPDEVHPQPSGARLYARTVAAAVRAARNAGASGQPAASSPPPSAHRAAPPG